MGVFLDSFSGGIGDLTARQRQQPHTVLQAIANDPNVSTWDMEPGGLWKTIRSLCERGMIESVEAAYPWHKYKVTEAGRRELEV